MQNLLYALIQTVHNFGAAAIVAVATHGFWTARGRAAPRLAWLLAALWALQGLTGALFGSVTYLYDGHFPDIHGVAVHALLIKVACVTLGFILAVHAARTNRPIWGTSWLLGVTALGSAAFLRWFS